MQVLLIKRNEFFEKCKWVILGGFVNFNESLEEGVIRKLKEEIGIDNVYIEQLYSFGDINRDLRIRVISIGNMVLIVKENINFNKNIKFKEIKWFWIDKKLVNSESYEGCIVNKYNLSLKSEDEEIEIKYEILESIEKSILRK